ncbi:MAG TPA: hypothetical protein VGK19_04010 [Capsulimonadaceae bacterium]|jgi:hypothetical protein
MNSTTKDKATGNRTTGERRRNGGNINGWGYIFFWAMTWFAIIMLSMTVELLPGVDNSAAMPQWCGPGIRHPVTAVMWSAFEVISGLIWGILAYGQHGLVLRFSVRLTKHHPLNVLLRRHGPQMVVALVMATCLGLPLALMDPSFRNNNMAGDLCETINPWAIKFEACFIPIAFGVASIVAGHMAGQRGTTDAQRTNPADDGVGQWPHAPKP